MPPPTDITIYKQPSIALVVIDGDAPADQSAKIAELEAQVATLTQQVADVTAEKDSWKSKVESGRIEAQQTVDALA